MSKFSLTLLQIKVFKLLVRVPICIGNLDLCFYPNDVVVINITYHAILPEKIYEVLDTCIYQMAVETPYFGETIF